MPTYDYECEACGHRFEEFQSITAKPIRRCPVCDKEAVKRLIGTGGGVIFKGSGFYATDYRSDSYKNSAKAEKDGSTSGSGEKTSAKSTSETSTSGSDKTSSGDGDS